MAHENSLECKYYFKCLGEFSGRTNFERVVCFYKGQEQKFVHAIYVYYI